MSVKLAADSILKPMVFKITLEVGGHKHTVAYTLEKPCFYREFSEAINRNFHNELQLFLERSLVPSPPAEPAPSPAIAAVEASPKSLDS